MSKFGNKLKNKALTKVGLKGAGKIAGKVGSKLATRTIPVVGQTLLFADGMKAILNADKEAPLKQLKTRAKSKSRAGRKL